MGRDGFLQRVNRWASKHGAARLTARQLRDLVDERVVPGPTRHPQPGQRTPIWNWGRNSYRSALQVCRLRARGGNSFAELRLLFWIHGDADFSESVRADLARVFTRMLNQMIRSTGADDPGPVTRKDAPDKRGSTIARRLGQPSPLLRPQGFEFPPNQLAGTYDIMRFGVEDEQPVARLLESLIGNTGLPPSFRDTILQLAGPALGMFSGLIGDPQETDNSAVATISDTKAEAFVRARDRTRQEFQKLRFMVPLLSSIADARFDAWKAPFSMAISTLRTPAWQIAWYVRWLHWAHNATAQERALIEDTNVDLRSIRTITGEDIA
jgi:hypothetical protein